jgi:transcriptional regulator with XRE-family HTH domain
MTLGDRIRELASDKSLNIKEFFSNIGASESTVQSYLRGSSTPNGEFLIKINAKIGVSPSWLLLGEGVKYGDHRSGDNVFPARVCGHSGFPFGVISDSSFQNGGMNERAAVCGVGYLVAKT